MTRLRTRPMRNSDLRAAVLAEARSWIDTPFRHQGAAKGAGVDCAMLTICVGRAVGVLDWTPERWAPFVAYGRLPNPAKMREAMATFLVEIAEAERAPGDVAWFAWRSGLPMHLAVMAEFEGRETMIHATQQIGRVVEHGYVPPWTRRIDSWWRYPGLAVGAEG